MELLKGLLGRQLNTLVYNALGSIFYGFLPRPGNAKPVKLQ